MPRSDNNLKAVLEDTAEAIRNKKGTSDPIIPRDFADEIDSIPQQGVDRSIDILTDNLFSYKLPDEIGITKQLKPYIFTRGNIKEIDLNNCFYVPSNAFSYTEGLGKVKGNNILYIDENGFVYCQKLSEIQMPNLVFTSYAGFAFTGLSGEINFEKMILAGQGMFSGCSKITKINLSNCTLIHHGAFSNCSNLSYASLFLFEQQITTPTGVFSNCQNLEAISATGVMHLGSYYFASCPKFTRIDGDNVLYNIQSMCFQSCSSLSEIDLTACRIVFQKTFYNCISLKKVLLAGEAIYQNAFENCNSLESLYILNASNDKILTLSNSNAFLNTPFINSSYLGHFGSIYVPSNLVSNYKSATNWNFFSDRITALPSEFESQYVFAYEFANRSDITEIPSEKLNVTKVLRNAFENCFNISQINLSNCSLIGQNAFSNCSSLSSINLPNCKGIMSYAFYNCSLKIIDLPNCKFIAESVFSNNGGIDLISAPDCEVCLNTDGRLNNGLDLPKAKVIKICNAMNYKIFSHNSCIDVRFNTNFLNEAYLPNVLMLQGTASRLTKLYAPNCVRIINLGLQSIESLDFPNLVWTSGYAFSGCSNLKNISLPKLTFLSNSTFLNCSSLEKINLPMATFNLPSTGGYHFGNCINLKKIMLPIAEKITQGMFNKCSSLESLYLFNNFGTLLSSNAFSSTPMVDSSYLGHYGSIFVPSGLLSWYQQDNMWSNYSERFVGLTDEEMQNVIDHFDD